MGWQGALVVWGAFGVAALAVWAATHGIRATLTPTRPAAPDPDEPRAPSTLRSSTTWLLVVAFGSQSFGFFAVSAWLPTLLHDHGYPATISGDITGVFQLFGAAGALLVPVAIARANMVVGVAVCMACWAVVPIGFLITPDLWWLWCVLGGVGQGAGITLVFSMIVGLGGGSAWSRRAPARCRGSATRSGRSAPPSWARCTTPRGRGPCRSWRSCSCSSRSRSRD
ncbi:MFS transporter [Pseudolysinimonas kribbensis]|uniref:MFS transporter n=1 Tax=Pseudolysinimonas kribbensis TaxID=433641 RepID=UPI0024E07805|nr:MFS transporter [Pseudolysinimonas kribbensis]